MGDGLRASSEYQRALDYLFVRTTGAWRFGLERTRALLDAIGAPDRALRVIHVGGTNGKGSVCAMLERVLRDRGFRVAKYTSPHLVDFRERMLVDGVPVSEGDVVEFIERWTPTIESLGATFFEATTAMAFALFARAEPDVAIIEVGLGGRLDSTNVVDPALAVVTSIGLDHTAYLGDTLEAIATEKAGIFKPGRPAVIGEYDDGIAMLLAHLAQTHGASPVDLVRSGCTARDISVEMRGTSFTRACGAANERITVALHGTHQAQNAMTALRVLELLPPPFSTEAAVGATSLGRVRLPGRFDIRGQHVFDVAHNPAGASVCAETLSALDLPRPRVAVLSVLGDKDWRGMMARLASVVDLFIVTLAPTSPENRAWNPEDAVAEAAARRWPAVLERDFDRALARAAESGQTVLVTGSFHTVGDAMARLQVSPLAE